MMRDDFAVFVLTHGRPNDVHTLRSLKRAGYTGRIVIVIDDEDKTADQYRRNYGDMVYQFSKSEAAETFDEADNFNDRRAIVYARNACFQIAKELGVRYFAQFDDDYVEFWYMFDENYDYGYCAITRTMDDLLAAMIDFHAACPAVATLAMSQGGDWIGGGTGDKHRLRRKAMNSFICDTQRPFKFHGRVNEDVNTYTSESMRGELFFTVMAARLKQKQTQSNAGGMTDLYLDSGTYVKSFYSVMFCPSAVKVGVLTDPRGGKPRLHHKINWHNVAPKILDQSHKKGGRDE